MMQSTPQDLRATMWEMITAHKISQILHSSARFSLAEHCANGPVTAEAIAQAEGCDPPFPQI